MTWHLYSWNFQLKSPLHVGFHKVMHFYRTRPYLTGKHLWGALTSKLTPLLGTNDYQKIGDFLKKCMRFGYLYPYAKGNLFIPKYTDEGLKFGSLSQIEFEKRFISSMASTAIDSHSLSAEEGMLHEVEFINSYTIDDGKPVFMKGLLWVRDFSENDISINKIDDNIFIKNATLEINLKERLFNHFQAGGEQKYGFGLMKLKDFIKFDNNKLEGFSGEWSDDGSEIKLKLNTNDSIWAHLLNTNSLNMKGNIEPLVGREWEAEKGAGRRLTSYGLFWSPGSVLNSNNTFKINEYNLWEVIT